MASNAQIQYCLEHGGRVVGRILVGPNNQPVVNQNGKPTKSLTDKQIKALLTTSGVIHRKGYDNINTLRFATKTELAQIKKAA